MGTDATTVGDLLARDRRSDRPALAAAGRTYDYHWLCTSAWKAGNFLRHAGVRRGVRVGVVGDGPLALLAFLGTALLEGTTRFAPPTDLRDVEDTRALVAPVDGLDEYDLPQGAQRVGYGGKPDDPGVHHFDAGLWSENPSFPPLEIDPDTPLLSDGDWTHTHGEVVTAARSIAEEYDLEPGTRVVVRAPRSDPRVVAAGVVAPLLAGGTIVLPTEDADADARGAVAVAPGGAPEPVAIPPEDVPLA